MNVAHLVRARALPARSMHLLLLLALISSLLIAVAPVSAAPRDTLPDIDADFVAGQGPDADQFATRDNPSPPSIDGDTMNVPTGIAVSETQAFVADRDNNRVLVYDLELDAGLLPPLDTFLNLGTTAAAAATDICLGQASCDIRNPQTTSQNTLNGPAAVAVNPAGTQIFVADSVNNRVLRFDVSDLEQSAPGVNQASLVLGQTAYTSNASGSGLGQLNNPQGVAVDRNGRVYVADTGNNRVLIYNTPLNTNGKPANVTLGDALGAGATQMNMPTGLAIGPDGKLYVADTGNNRVLVFDTPFTNGKAATKVYGQTGFGAAAPGAGTTGMRGPSDVAVDAANNVFVADRGNNRVLQFDQNASDSDTTADRVFGQNNFSGISANRGSGTPNYNTLNEPTGLAVHPTLRDLYVADSANHRALQFWTPVPNSVPVIDEPPNLAFRPYPGETAPPTTAFTLLIRGRDFAPGATVIWNGQELLGPANVQSTEVIEIPLDPTEVTTLLATPRVDIPIEVANPVAERFPPPDPAALVSNAVDYAVCLPKPVIESFSPESQMAGSTGFVLTINGSNFVANTLYPMSMTWGGNPVDQNDILDITPTEMRVFIRTTEVITPGVIPITVSNFSAGEVCENTTTSVIRNFRLTTPVPAITSFSPASAVAGSTQPFTLTINGTGFVPTSVVRWNGEERLTTFLNQGQLEITVPVDDILPEPGSVPITVFNPPDDTDPVSGGGTSPARNFPFVSSVDPTINQLIPPEIEVGNPAFLLTVRGSNFTAGARVYWEGSERVVVTRSSGEIVVAIRPEDVMVAGTYEVVVDDPTDTIPPSVPAIFTVFNPTPRIDNLSPASTTAGGGEFTLTIEGGGFVADSLVRWNDETLTPNPATRTRTRMEVTVPANLSLTAGTASITVENPEPRGGSSNARSFTIGEAGALLINTIAPATASVGGAAFDLTITGEQFLDGATVLWNTTELTPSLVSSTEIVVNIPSELLANAGVASIAVVNPEPDGRTSNIVQFTIGVESTELQIDQISPNSTLPGVAVEPLTITGQNFAQGASVLWGDLPLMPDSVSTTEIVITIPASLVTTEGIVSVAVVNPDNERSNAVPFTIGEVASGPQITRLDPDTVQPGATLSLTIEGQNFESGATVRWNDLTLIPLQVNDTRIVVNIPPSLTATAGMVNIIVTNPNGETSNTAVLTIGEQPGENRVYLPIIVR